jgi:aminopeptidase-like protein
MSAALLENLRSIEACRAHVREAQPLMERLYPICRSITGDGVRQTLAELAKLIPLDLTDVPTGTPVFDWEVPREWNIRAAWITDPSGKRIVDFRDHSLHIVNYSTPIDAELTLNELKPHLHSLPDHPDWIPYRTTYYEENWGFCLRHRMLETLGEGRYRVHIDSTLSDGHLTYAECVIPGETEQEFLVFTHVCHPSLCNDNLTGIALTTTLAAQLLGAKPRHTFRFVFAPGTIGSITWLSRNEGKVQRIRHGLVLGLLGDQGPLTYKRSRRLNCAIDAIAAHVLPALAPTARLLDFSPYGYDERQLCSPGFDLPVGRLTRSPNNGYPEYHTSADDFSILSERSLAESLQASAALMRVADRNESYLNLNPKCEPRLGKRGLFRGTGGTHLPDFENALLWVLSQSDGSHSLLDIAVRSGLPFDAISAAADALQSVQLLRSTDSAGGARVERS